MGKPSRCQHRERPAESIGGCEPTRGSEPSQYPEEKKTNVIPLVAASERGTAQTQPSFEISNLRFEISEEGWGLEGARRFRALELPIRRLAERLGKVGHRV
jgi:hypothetical protein